MDERDYISSDSDSSSLEDEAETRVRRLMDRIFKKRENLKSEDDVNEMVAECSSMLEDMNFKSKKENPSKANPISRSKEGKGGGDHVSPKHTPTLSSKVTPKKKSASSTEYLEQLVASPAVKDLMKDKKDKPNFTDIYKQRVAEMMAKAPPTNVKAMLGKSKDDSWRKKIEELMEKDSSESLKSSELSSNESGLDPEEEKMFQKAISAAYSEDQFDGKKTATKDPNQFSLSKEDYQEAKKKAEEWLRAREPDMEPDDWNKMELEDISSEVSSDSDVPPSRKNLQKKTEDQLKTLKAKLAEFEPSKPTVVPKKSPPSLSRATPPAASQKKIPSAKGSSLKPNVPGSSTTRKTVKK